MSHTALNYSRWDSLEEPSDDEDTGACIGMPGRDGGAGAVYRWDELRTELPWQHQAPDDAPVATASHAGTPKQAEVATPPAGGAGTSLNHEELSRLSTRLGEVTTEIETKTERWIELDERA